MESTTYVFSFRAVLFYLATTGRFFFNGRIQSIYKSKVMQHLPRIQCLVGEKPDKELPGIVGARGDTV